MAEISPVLYADWVKARDFAAEANKQAAELATEIKESAGEDTELTVNGQVVAHFDYIKKFASKRFLDDHPELAEQFSITREVTEVDERQLKRLLPEVYRKYQVRSLTLADG